MKKELVDYFYNHYEEKGEPYPNPVSYTDVSDFMKNVNDKNVQDIIYLVGLHEIAKEVVFDGIKRLG